MISSSRWRKGSKTSDPIQRADVSARGVDIRQILTLLAQVFGILYIFFLSFLLCIISFFFSLFLQDQLLNSDFECFSKINF